MARETGDDMIQSAVRLPRSLHERLKKAGGERGMGEEIRRRLDASFDADMERSDPKTSELLEAIAFIARLATTYYGDWAADTFAFQVLKASVDQLLKHCGPKGDPDLAKPNPTEMGKLIFGKDSENLSPEEISQTLVKFWLMSEAIVGRKG
jgi:hypothetical protein